MVMHVLSETGNGHSALGVLLLQGEMALRVNYDVEHKQFFVES